jgi:hypothetical protein
MHEILTLQKAEANVQFCKFVERNYLGWIKDPENGPTAVRRSCLKRRCSLNWMAKGPLFFILIDNLRYDQFKIINPIISEYFRLEEEDTYYSILPTATQYARNSIFSGLMPLEMETRYPRCGKTTRTKAAKTFTKTDFVGDNMKRLTCVRMQILVP